MSYNTEKFDFIITIIDFFSFWCVLLILDIIFFTGPISLFLSLWLAYYGYHSIKMQKNLGYLPHDTLLFLVKTKRRADSIKKNARSKNTGENQKITARAVHYLPPDGLEENKKYLPFCAFITSPKTRHGFRALTACAALSAFIFSGIDGILLGVATAGLFFYGLCKVVQGGMDVL